MVKVVCLPITKKDMIINNDNKNINHKNKNHKNSSKHYIVKKEVDNVTLKYSRASLIIIEESYDNGNGRNEPAIILFYCEKWNTFVEPGGRIEKLDMELDDLLVETAKRELSEETLNSICVDISTLKSSMYIDFKDTKTKMYSRVFTIGIKGNQFDKNIYYDNKEIISKSNAPIVWKETTNVERFYISDIVNSINGMGYEYNKSDNILCKNVNGGLRNIYYRTIGMLEQLINENLTITALVEPKEMVSYDFCSNKFSDKFLMGTKTFGIKV